MGRVEENRAENYIRKHRNHKRWIAFALCVALLTGSCTLYMLNKPATAMTEEGAGNVGLVLETADTEYEHGLIEKMEEAENSEDGEQASLNSDAEETEDSAKEQAGDADTSTESESTEAAESTEEGAEEAGASESKEENTEASELKDDEKTGKEKPDKEDTDKEITTPKSVSLTARYVDRNGEEIKESEKLSIEKEISFDGEETAVEGFFFDGVTFEEKRIAKITPVYAQAETEEEADKEEEEQAEEQKEEVKTEESEQAEAEGVEAEKAEPEKVEVEKAEAVTDEAANAEAENSEAAKAETEKNLTEDAGSLSDESENSAETIPVAGYIITTEDGEELTVSEDSEIVFHYIKATDKTEFTFRDNKITVKATTKQAGVFPEGIELKATEVTPTIENYNYDAYLSALNENCEAIAKEAGKDNAVEFTADNTLLYDIAFMFEGKEIQPLEGTVSISIEFRKNQLSEDIAASNDDDIAVVHLPIKEEVKEAANVNTTEEATMITASDVEVITLTEATAAVENGEKVEFEAENFSIFAVLAYQSHLAGTDTYETVLGDAVNFAIVADELEQNEAETNFAVKKIVSTQNQSGNDLTNPMEQTFMVAETEFQFNVKGYPAYFIIPADYRSKIKALGNTVLYFDTSYSKEELIKAVSDMLEYTRAASADLAQRDSDITFPEDTNRYVVDTTGLPDNKTYYVNVSEEDYEVIKYAEGISINKLADQTIVFNVHATGNLVFNKYKINGIPSDTIAGQNNNTGSVTPEYAKYARTIIWNFIDVESVTVGTPVVGVMISGNSTAKWINNSTSAGWVAFPKVHIESGEWHNTYDHVTKISGTAQLQAYKTIDGVPSTVSGFTFGVYRKNGNTWETEPFLTAKNDGHDVVFDPIEYGEDESKKDDALYEYLQLEADSEPVEFVYRIVETDAGSYSRDSRTKEFFAKVTVTASSDVQDSRGIVTNAKYYVVSAPEYYTDAACKNRVLVKDESGKQIPSIPTFNNKTEGEYCLKVIKNWTQNGVEPENTDFTEQIYVKIYRSYDRASGDYGEDCEEIDGVKYELVKWAAEPDGVYKSGDSGLEYLPISKDMNWQIKLITDSQHPQNANLKYKYYVREYQLIDEEYVEKTGLVTYKSGNDDTSSTDWSKVYTYAGEEDDSGIQLTIVNELGGNVLPNTGGIGSLPYMAHGVGIAVAGLLGGAVYRKKKDEDEPEDN